MANIETCECPGAVELISDLEDDNLLDLQPGERLWKLWCFRAAGHATDLRHRIYTKLKADGRLAMVTFAAHNPPISGNDGEATGGRAVRSAIARVPDLSSADLDRLIVAMQTQAGRDACEEIDLTGFENLHEQLDRLRALTNP